MRQDRQFDLVRSRKRRTGHSRHKRGSRLFKRKRVNRNGRLPFLFTNYSCDTRELSFFFMDFENAQYSIA